MIDKLIVSQIFIKPIGMMGNLRNVFFESNARCCLTVKVFVGMFCLPPMAKRQKSAII